LKGFFHIKKLNYHDFKINNINPATNKVIFEQANKFKHELIITNYQGQILKKERLLSLQESIDFSNFPTGLYFYRIVSKQESVQTGKIIVQQ